MPLLPRTMDGNEAVASIAYRLSEVIGIYPITPATAMGEQCDDWAAHGKSNIWGTVPTVVEMQSEAGAIAAVHGALQAGSLATTFTASQGLLLMLPNMYKIAGELLPCVIHVAARTVATHALSIFCDHSDVMACRQTGFALLASGSVQQAHDFACIASLSTLKTRVPFLHFFDGFRTSHELVRVRELGDTDLETLFDERALTERRRAALSPDHPSVRGTAQNPDVFFQAREATNRFYRDCPAAILDTMAHFAALTGRSYGLFEYTGHPAAERVIVAMGSAVATVQETVHELVRRGERVGVIAVALFRPFSVEHFVEKLPASVRRVAVLDRCKEPGAVGEPLYLDVVSALAEAGRLDHTQVIGGRYGLASKEFTPSMVARVFEELEAASPRRHFSLGITDDVTLQSLDGLKEFDAPEDGSYQAIFFGLGSDGTVGANKGTIKILGDAGNLEVQGFFVFDSKKAGTVTVSHLRFGPRPIARPYLVTNADLVACHQYELLDRLPVVDRARDGGVLLLNSPYAPSATWQHLSREVQAAIVEKRLRLYVIDGYRVAAEAGLGKHINTVMQACFFVLSKVLPVELGLLELKRKIELTYSKKGEEVVRRNLAAVDAARAALEEVRVPDVAASDGFSRPRQVSSDAPAFVRRVTSVMMAGQGDRLPVSAFPVDGCWPSGTGRFEKRRLARAIPTWDEAICIQCNKCVFVCPHAAIRAKVLPDAALVGAPPGFQSTAWKGKDFPGERYTLAVAPEDCTGCQICVEACPAKEKDNPRHRALNMEPIESRLEQARAEYDFFLRLPPVERRRVHLDVKGSQLLDPLFEYSGACAGCGETPYIKLLTQLFGDRLVIANATGCSSIYGGNLPTTPYTVGPDGRGPAWANSLFEDNAEFGFGIRLALDAQRSHAKSLVAALAHRLPPALVEGLLATGPRDDRAIAEQRERIEALRAALQQIDEPAARTLIELSDQLSEKSLWIVGGDGWAYDIGFGGLDHVLASSQNVNILVLDTEVYSNTGGQRSKATPRGAAAKFATLGKDTEKKDLGLHAMSYGNVFVARVAFGAKDAQTVRAFVEAEAYPGPSLVIAYAPCIAHGYDLRLGAAHQKLAVDSGVWPLFRFDPRRIDHGEAPLVLDSTPGKSAVREYMQGEARFTSLRRSDPDRHEALITAAEQDVQRRTELYLALSRIQFSAAGQKR